MFRSVKCDRYYDPDKLPKDLLADEHHIRIRGEKAYVATARRPGTIGQGCILGAGVCSKVDEVTLKEGYQIFQQEALNRGDLTEEELRKIKSGIEAQK